MMAQTVAKQLDDAIDDRIQPNSFTEYISANLKCWKTDKNINKLQDGAPYHQYPDPIFELNDASFKGRRVWFGGSEAAENWTGMIEGAIMNGTVIGKKVADLL